MITLEVSCLPSLLVQNLSSTICLLIHRDLYLIICFILVNIVLCIWACGVVFPVMDLCVHKFMLVCVDNSFQPVLKFHCVINHQLCKLIKFHQLFSFLFRAILSGFKYFYNLIMPILILLHPSMFIKRLSCVSTFPVSCLYNT